MQARTSQVELPSVTALFADISSKGPERQRRWSPRTPITPKVPGCTAPSKPACRCHSDPSIDIVLSTPTPAGAWQRWSEQLCISIHYLAMLKRCSLGNSL